MSGHIGMEHYRSLPIKGKHSLCFTLFRVTPILVRTFSKMSSYMLPAKVGPGFGIGALEELDAEDEDIYASG